MGGVTALSNDEVAVVVSPDGRIEVEAAGYVAIALSPWDTATLAHRLLGAAIEQMGAAGAAVVEVAALVRTLGVDVPQPERVVWQQIPAVEVPAARRRQVRASPKSPTCGHCGAPRLPAGRIEHKVGCRIAVMLETRARLAPGRPVTRYRGPDPDRRRRTGADPAHGGGGAHGEVDAS